MLFGAENYGWGVAGAELAPGVLEPKVELPKVELPKVELPVVELPKVELPTGDVVLLAGWPAAPALPPFMVCMSESGS